MRGDCESSERDALAAARGVVVTSPSTAQLLVDDYDVPPDRITVALPGHRSRRSRRRAAATASCGCSSVGAIVPRKGYRRADRGAGDADRPALASHHRRRPHARSRRRAAQLDADIAAVTGLARASTLLGALPADRIAALYAGVRPVRAGLALRGLRHGLCRGAGARPAGDRHDGRRHPRHRAARCRRAGRAERREGAGARAADADRKSERAAVARGRRARRRRSAADLARLGQAVRRRDRGAGV